MVGIVGTIAGAKEFLSNTEVLLAVHPDSLPEQKIVLPSSRRYSIPAFQRELRWDDNNLKMLLSDLSRNAKFLGNIILTIHGDTCEIIDGQQRTTVLMLIIACIKKKFGTQIDTPELCPLHNQSFEGFSELLNIAFDRQLISKEKWDELLATDDYKQYVRISKLWNAIESSELLSDRHKAQGLLDNINNSEFNIIASYSENVNTSIQYFLDVNLKGIRLDTEDIFKGYLFSQDDRVETRTLWQKNKCAVLQLNSLSENAKDKKYPLMKLYEHFFYCDLYRQRDGICEYGTLKFGENFCLTEEFTSGTTKFYEGCHLIEAIRDRNYLQTVLRRLNKCVEIMIDIIGNEGPSHAFKDKFVCDERIDSIDIANCHFMLKKILMEKEVIPKILALKYIMTYLDGNEHSKKEYKSFYSVFCASVLFTIFANKKESNTFYGFVKSEDWVGKINEWLFSYVASHELTKGKVLAAYKYSDEDDDRTQQIRCKALAAINNFFKISRGPDGYHLKISNVQKLNDFLTNKSTYSLEHFIIAESGNLQIKTEKYDFSYSYPTQTKKYRNSLFNYVFIPRALNQSLENTGLHSKLAVLRNRRKEVDCAYSISYLELLDINPSQYFENYPTSEKVDTCKTQDDVEKMLDSYFNKYFADEFLSFSIALMKKFSWG